jgi:predicted small secreted protein
MKRFYTLIMLFSLSSATFVGCSSGRNTTKGIGGTVVKTVATVVGIILLSKLVKSILKAIGGSTAFAGLSEDENFMKNFNENTKLDSFVQNYLMKTALQVLVSEHYQIPFSTVTNNYSNLTTVGDLATFIGKNASAKALLEIK